MMELFWWFLPIFVACGSVALFLSKRYKGAVSKAQDSLLLVKQRLQASEFEQSSKEQKIKELASQVDEQKTEQDRLSLRIVTLEQTLAEERKRNESYQEVDKKIAEMISEHALNLEAKLHEIGELQGKCCSLQAIIEGHEQKARESEGEISRLTSELNAAQSELARISAYVKEYQTASIVIKSGRSVKQHGFVQENRGALNQATS